MAMAKVLHWIAVALILAAVGCFLLVPVFGMTMIFVAIAIETLGYLVWGAEFWTQPKQALGQGGESSPKK